MDLEQHLKLRHVNMELHCPILDEVEGVATFYLWNLSGQLVGYQQYRPFAGKTKANHPREGRYFTFHKAPTVAVFGTESLHLTPHVVFLTEGVFDATRLTNLGVSALAVLTNNPSKDTGNFLRMLGRTVVCVCDNDAAGRKLAKFGNHVVYTQDKDLGESSPEFVQSLVQRFV